MSLINDEIYDVYNYGSSYSICRRVSEKLHEVWLKFEDHNGTDIQRKESIQFIFKFSIMNEKHCIIRSTTTTDSLYY